MPFTKGHKKTGGRKKGTPNKMTTVLNDLCEGEGINPFQALLKIANDPKTKLPDKINVLKSVSEYLYPKRQRVEIDGMVYAKVVREIEALSKLPTEELKELIKKEMEKLNSEAGQDDL